MFQIAPYGPHFCCGFCFCLAAAYLHDVICPVSFLGFNAIVLKAGKEYHIILVADFNIFANYCTYCLLFPLFLFCSVSEFIPWKNGCIATETYLYLKQSLQIYYMRKYFP